MRQGLRNPKRARFPALSDIVAPTGLQRASKCAAVVLAAAVYVSGAVGKGASLSDPVMRLTTAAGNIDVELAISQAPVTVCNFIRNAEKGAYDGGAFFRTVHRDDDVRSDAPIDVVQAQAADSAQSYPPIELERTSRTGLSHGAGTVSMARDAPDTATSSFFIVVTSSKALDFGGGRHPDGQGFAAFGKVIEGMDVVRAIHDSRSTREMIAKPVEIRAARIIRGDTASCR